MKRFYLSYALALTIVSPALARERVVLAVDGIAQTRNLPVLVAERMGYFKAEDLTVTLVDAPAEPSPAQLLADGRADGAVAFFHHTFVSQIDDGPIARSVVVMGVAPQLKLIVAARLRGKVAAVADLKGLRIAVGGPNSGKTIAMNWLAARADLGPHDYTALPAGKHAAIAAALTSGTLDAVIAHEPDADAFVAEGAGFELVDLESGSGTRAALGSAYPSTALYLPAEYVAAHRDTVQHLVNACLRALDFIRNHTAAEIAAAVGHKDTETKDEFVYRALLSLDKQAFDTDGMVSRDSAEAELQALSLTSQKFSVVNIDKTFTNYFVKSYISSKNIEHLK